MRADAKIGILAGLVIALGIIVYVFSSGGAKPEAEQTKPGTSEIAPDEQARDILPPAEGTEPQVAPPPPEKDVVTFPGWPPKVEVNQTTADEPLAADLEQEGEPVVVPSPAPPLVAEEPDIKVQDVVVPIEPVEKVDTAPEFVDVGQPQVYTVQAGDLGFWGVATKVYRAGSKWRLIAKANPDADTNNLRPGQRLVIPALPKEEKKSRAEQGVDRTQPPALADGQTYEVRPGDAGFWGIAAKLYNDGSKWHLIKKANPGLDSRRLHPGTRLIIPSLSEARWPAEPERAVQDKPAPRPAPQPLELPADGRPRFYDVVRAEL